jgi:XTP/dITP diphosphohydrolase
VTRVVLLVTSPRVATGLLSAAAWDAVRAGPVLTDDPEAPLARLLADDPAVDVHSVALDVPTRQVAEALLAAATEAGTATWLVSPGSDGDLAAAAADLAAGREAELEIMHGSWDLPGSRLLDVVAVMDRLRSPDGCPWDAGQTHTSLAPYLIEEAYEALQAIEDDNLEALRDELGDVLLQVVFHARLAEELPDGQRWTVDDVAGSLVDKLVRRHPHVFADTEVADADEVNANWETIKSAERGGGSALETVPMTAAALLLAATLQRKAERAGLPSADVVPWLASDRPPAAVIADLAARLADTGTSTAAGDLLWAVVGMLRGMDLDAEDTLRVRARTFRDWAIGTSEGTGIPPGG